MQERIVEINGRLFLQRVGFCGIIPAFRPDVAAAAVLLAQAAGEQEKSRSKNKDDEQGDSEINFDFYFPEIAHVYFAKINKF